ncbi:hypothetical protein SAMN06297382_0450 [Amphiplicatus metriothermophilus]|uniref:Uncharacterized protein n=1 Tax=Amphiplicatus metriothermophilus TaxID=1519374 RepID=A0A239PK51_9PROT|nr:hypothetical protein [Amphiplicatus metriothermophilus]SNT67955.1 hypothetical protein SAMN06297382_0450 [Amphiplicatus metriothermophilus]
MSFTPVSVALIIFLAMLALLAASCLVRLAAKNHPGRRG